jgi:hypothetical protein
MGFLKTLGIALYQRVLVNYKPTLIGLGLASAVLVVDETTAVLQGLPDGWAKIAASLLALGGAYLRSKAPTAPSAP